MSLKPRYHSDAYRSRFYAAQESFARALLESIVSRNRLPLEVVSLGLTETEGVVPNYYSSLENRFDYALVRSGDKAVVALVEVTGDGEGDNLARILSEKIERIEAWLERRRFPCIFVMYLKRSRFGLVRKVRFFRGYDLVAAYRVGCDSTCFIDEWIPGEKPYLFIDLRTGLTTRQFVALLKKLPFEIGKTIPRITIDELLRR